MRTPTLVACVLVMLGCASVAQPDAPGVIVDANQESRAELQRAVSAALNRSDITLADDALTRDSLLIIERTPARDPTGQRLSGRDLDKPEQFQLVTSNGGCVLIHVRTGQRYPLARTRCAAAGAK